MHGTPKRMNICDVSVFRKRSLIESISDLRRGSYPVAAAEYDLERINRFALWRLVDVTGSERICNFVLCRPTTQNADARMCIRYAANYDFRALLVTCLYSRVLPVDGALGVPLTPSRYNTTQIRLAAELTLRSGGKVIAAWGDPEKSVGDPAWSRHVIRNLAGWTDGVLYGLDGRILHPGEHTEVLDIKRLSLERYGV